MTDTEEVQTDLTADEEFALLTQEGNEEGNPAEDQPPATDKIKIGDKEYDLDTLATLIPVGERAQEIEKGARQKFDEAAALRKEMDVKAEQLSDMQTIWNAWTQGTAQEKQLILQQLAQEIPGEGINEADLTDNEAAIKRAFEQRMAGLEAQNKQLQETLKALVPVLEDVKAWTGTKKEAEVMQGQIAEIKTKTGMDVSPELLSKWKESGITDPIKALDVILPMLQAVKNTPDKQPEIPNKTLENTFDPDDPSIDVDEMFHRMNRGEVPSR